LHFFSFFALQSQTARHYIDSAFALPGANKRYPSGLRQSGRNPSTDPASPTSTRLVDTAYLLFKSGVRKRRIDLGIEHKIRVLVVEDNPTTANLLRTNLTRRGFDVECLAYLGLAMERVHKPGLDVILLDLSLPDSDGIGTFYDLHAIATETPIVILSSATDQNVAQAAIDGGAQDYLVKGIASDESVARCLRYAIERYQFERRVWESERMTRLIVENAPDAFVSMDGSGRITSWNIKAEAIFGWYRKDALGKFFTELIIPSEMRSLFNHQIQSFLQHGTRSKLINNQAAVSLVHRSGKLFPAELTLFPVTIGSGYTLCAFIHDITQQKQIEKQLLSVNGELERVINQNRRPVPEAYNESLLAQRPPYSKDQSGPITLSLRNEKPNFR
jgi:PAS domain S-box-containing protein